MVHWNLGCWEADGQSKIVFLSCYQFQGPPKQHLHQLVFSFLKLQEFKSLPREDPFRAPSAGKTLCGATINVDSKVWTWSPWMLLQRWGTKDGKRMWSSPALGRWSLKSFFLRYLQLLVPKSAALSIQSCLKVWGNADSLCWKETVRCQIQIV